PGIKYDLFNPVVLPNHHPFLHDSRRDVYTKAMSHLLFQPEMNTLKDSLSQPMASLEITSIPCLADRYTPQILQTLDNHAKELEKLLGPESSTPTLIWGLVKSILQVCFF